ncbi:MAG: hypothetical protein U0R17_05105 [Acidimicrobiia bacterium]
MAYDPKKTRPKAKAKESVVDELLEEKKPAAKKKPAPKPKKDNVQIAPKAKEEPEESNVIEFPNKEQEIPLIMQPQVWVATGAVALVLLLMVKRRKKR